MSPRSLLVIAILGAGCGAGTITDDVAGDDTGGSGTEAAHAFCVDETNRLRTGNGRAAVARSAELEAYADEGAAIDHDGSPHQHFGDTSGGGIAFAENECPHWSLASAGGDLSQLVGSCIEAFFSEGPGGGHYDNMMGNYAALGCGLYVEGDSVTIIQDFGP
jgi:hypothetical protein